MLASAVLLFVEAFVVNPVFMLIATVLILLFLTNEELSVLAEVVFNYAVGGLVFVWAEPPASYVLALANVSMATYRLLDEARREGIEV